jgi:hypothetical protein
VLSDREAHRLRGIEAADSVTVDFHKLWFQAISCGAFLVRDAASLAPAHIHADYLNADGLPALVDKSLQTTRRFDALKLLVSLRAHGRRFLGRAVETTLDLAAEAARLIESEPCLELVQPVSLNTVLFRYSCGPARAIDRVNDAIRLVLLHGGQAVVGRTRLDGRVVLKLTLMNPAATPDDVRRLLALVVAAGARQGLAPSWRRPDMARREEWLRRYGPAELLALIGALAGACWPDLATGTRRGRGLCGGARRQRRLLRVPGDARGAGPMARSVGLSARCGGAGLRRAGDRVRPRRGTRQPRRAAGLRRRRAWPRSGRWRGVLAGKLVADLVFYVPVIARNEWRKRVTAS